MRIGIGADHRGFELKKYLMKFLNNRGFETVDYGTGAGAPADYPLIAFALAEDIAGRRLKRGILICFSGQGMAIAANKVRGIRAAVCADARTAGLARAHNDANVLVLPARIVNAVKSRSIVNKFISTVFEGGRHRRRLRIIRDYENFARVK